MPQFKQYQQGDDKPTFRELRSFVGVYVEYIYLSNGDMLAINEEGAYLGLKDNTEATKIWHDDLREQYGSVGSRTLKGNVAHFIGGYASVKNQLKDNEGTEATIGDCLEDVIDLLEQLDKATTDE
jgi:hypothetical protein